MKTNHVNNRTPFFPNSKSGKADQAGKSGEAQKIARNSVERFQEIKDRTAKDANVDIPTAVKDFSKIKKAVDAAPQVDNSQKIADLKARIQSGNYEIDYDGLANKILSEEF